MFNSAYSTGGAPCAVKTVETLSGLRMDHYLEVDFSGFQQLIDDLGGVEVTTSEAIKDPDSHLDLPAGTHTLDGEQALGLVRTRHGVGDGSDLGRIQLQQAFVKALVDQVKDIGLLGNPKKLYDIADTATKTVTTDSDLGSVNSPDVLRDRTEGHHPGQHAHGHDAGRLRPRRPEPGPAGEEQGGSGLDGPEERPADPGVGHSGHGHRRGQGRREHGGIDDGRPRFWGMAPVLADWTVGPGSRSRIPRRRPGTLPNLGDTLKRDIHPEYVETQVSCTCGASFTTRSTIESGTIRAEVCSECHPFYTGKQKILDTGGRVARFEARFGKAAAGSKK